MPIDLEAAHLLILVVAGALGIAGTVFGWFSNAFRWMAGKISALRSPGPTVPRRTLILNPMPRGRPFWWHMGSAGDEPAMQIVAELKATNIHTGFVWIMGAKLRRPRAAGMVTVRAANSSLHSTEHVIHSQSVTDLHVSFFVQPPVCAVGKPFKADFAVIDQFGNERWLRRAHFVYS